MMTPFEIDKNFIAACNMVENADAEARASSAIYADMRARDHQRTLDLNEACRLLGCPEGELRVGWLLRFAKKYAASSSEIGEAIRKAKADGVAEQKRVLAERLGLL